MGFTDFLKDVGGHAMNKFNESYDRSHYSSYVEDCEEMDDYELINFTLNSKHEAKQLAAVSVLKNRGIIATYHSDNQDLYDELIEKKERYKDS